MYFAVSFTTNQVKNLLKVRGANHFQGATLNPPKNLALISREYTYSIHPLRFISLQFHSIVQVVSALSSCKPVVTPAWIEEAVRCHQSSLPLPSPSTFQPSVVDANIESGTAVSLAPNYGRTSLFQDCVFYFMSEKQVRTCIHHYL